MSKHTGKIKFYNREKAFGFIVHGDGSKDMFFHKTGLLDNYIPKEGDTVTYDTFDGKKGTEALDIELA